MARNQTLQQLSSSGILHHHPVAVVIRGIRKMIYQLYHVAMSRVLQRCHFFCHALAKLVSGPAVVLLEAFCCNLLARRPISHQEHLRIFPRRIQCIHI